MMKYLTQNLRAPALAAAAIFAAVAILGAPHAAAQEHAGTIVKTGKFSEDVVAAGREVRVEAEVDGGVIVMGRNVQIHSQVSGDVVSMGGNLEVGDAVKGDIFVAGGRVRLDAQSGGDVFVMGGSIEASNRVGGDLRMMGGKVENKAAVAGNAMLAGHRIDLDKDANIAGNAWVLGSRVEVDGRVGGDLRAAGRRVKIGGEVRGNVHIDGIDVEIERSAVFHGNVTYRSPNRAEIHPEAKIQGDVTFIQSQQPTEAVGAAFAAVGTIVIVSLLALFVLGAVQVLVLPELSLAAARRGLTEPWKALGLGIAILIVAPFLIALLFPTLVGVPLGLVLGAIYVVLLALGFMVAALAVGRKGLAFLGKNWDGGAWGRIGLVAIGLVVIAILAIIPFLGALVVFAAMGLGAGALVVQLLQRPAAAT